MNKRIGLFLILVLLCVFMAATAYGKVNEGFIDNTTDDSVSTVTGRVYITGSGGLGDEPVIVYPEKSFNAAFSNPKTESVQSAINDAYNIARNRAEQLKSKGKAGEYHMSTTSNKKREWDNRKYDSDLRAIIPGVTDSYDFIPGVPLTYNSSGDNYTYSGTINGSPCSIVFVKDPESLELNGIVLDTNDYTVSYTHIASGSYGRETSYIVEASGWVSGYSITVTSEGNGTAKASKDAALTDDVITLTATPESGYHLEKWEVLSGGITVAGNQFTVGTEDVEIKAVFEEGDPEPEPSTPTNPTNPTNPPNPTEPTETEKIAFSKLKKVKLTALSAKKLKLTWKKLSKKDQKKIQKIQIQYSTDKTFQTGVQTRWAKKSKAAYTIKGLKKNTKYWVRIRAWKKDGNITYVSNWVTKGKKTKKK